MTDPSTNSESSDYGGEDPIREIIGDDDIA